ncbi:hypothetical protein [Paenibacillus sacheonensis]|uniref:Asp/Glu/hydantoin racemase n=1 Tax=Paenibacillus sacheonensis TaxID=742054 RepID=A0A7X4YN17_9BACL|nr:hypothetical protein [Paenibacillus sacheonensis]MBM7564847.1 hypothetical protein [Paenibacillus sacheonensis]NBC69395.1 hypothetical protein [Paenibacillus sacheonensis]
MKRIGCLHAHHSNIDLIEEALHAFDVELVHFVEPGLDRLKHDAEFSLQDSEKKVLETIGWVSRCHVDAILVTCTYFTGLLHDDSRQLGVPVIKIDEPLNELLIGQEGSAVFVFTNPATVAGTMAQFERFAAGKGNGIFAEAKLLPGTFELIMQGRKEEYVQAVTEGLQRIAMEQPEACIVAAQLSMVPAARQVAALAGNKGIRIVNQLDALTGCLVKQLSIARRSR